MGSGGRLHPGRTGKAARAHAESDEQVQGADRPNETGA